MVMRDEFDHWLVKRAITLEPDSLIIAQYSKSAANSRIGFLKQIMGSLDATFWLLLMAFIAQLAKLADGQMMTVI